MCKEMIAKNIDFFVGICCSELVVCCVCTFVEYDLILSFIFISSVFNVDLIMQCHTKTRIAGYCANSTECSDHGI